MKDLSKIKLFLFDLDGTVYLGDKLLGDAKNTLKLIRDNGKKVGFLTNNSSTTDLCYIEKLKRLGIWEDGDFFYSSLDAVIDFFNAENQKPTVYAVATKDVVCELNSRGITLTQENPDMANTVLLTFDKELTYNKIENANRLIKNGARYFATHPDKVCPTLKGDIPDVGAFIKMFKESAKRTPDVYTGKPFLFLANEIIKKFSKEIKNTEEICMVGDRLYTDIAFGINANFCSVLVLSGETKISQAKKSKIKPDYILKDISEIKNFL